MADKILLCISATQAVVVQTRGHGGGIVRCEIFQPDQAGLAAFDDFLSSAPAALVYLCADTVEEDYRFETLPHATGADRAAMLDRKLKQYYRNTPYAAASFRGRSSDKRRDDRYLLAALTNPGLIDPWLGAITRHGLPVAGLYLVSMLTAALVRELGETLSRVLVVAPHGAGLRLTFYKDGEFCISRLSRGGAGDNATRTPDMITSEISSTRHYLSSLHLDATDEPLPVLFLDHDDSLAPVVEHLNADSPSLACVRISRETLIRQLHITPDHFDLALETAYLKLLAEQAPDTNLAPASITSGHRQFQRRKAVYAASATLGLAGMVWAGYNLWVAYDLGQQTAFDGKRTASAQSQYQEITREFPAAPTTSENLSNAVEIYKKVSKTVRSPHPFMQIVSRAIEATPEVFLQEMTWTYGTETVSADASSRAPQPAVQALASTPGALKQSGTFVGEIRPFQGDYRAAIDAINNVAKRLAGDPAVADVRVVKYPLNVSPGLALSGNTKDAAEHAGVADFKIILTLKPDA